MKNFTLLSLIILVSVKCLGQTTHTVNSGSFYYTPASLTIDVGDSVVWINDGGFHDVNGANNSITNEPYNNPVIFNSDATNDIDAVIFSFKFNVPGVYNYDCSIGEHAASGMTGLVIVEAPLNSINEIISKDIYISKLVLYVNDAKTRPPTKRKAISAIGNRRFSLLALLLFLISITFVILIVHLNSTNNANNVPK